MHGPADAWSLWQEWRRVEEERAAMLADLHSVAVNDAGPPPAVIWGRRCYTSADEILAAPAPAWARLDPSAMQRHLDRATALADALESAQQRAQGHREATGLSVLEHRAQQLANEGLRLAASIRRAPINKPADVLARLDLIAAMWGPAGEIGEPGAPLAEVLALIEALSRHAPQFTPTWTRRRTAQPS
ncbi:hypothetical protein [Azospirillum sp.]|uniref:hypothetical protein n=1 Tax=Azospirillum sp. TaxID=34012 RepID=UPI003D746B50